MACIYFAFSLPPTESNMAAIGSRRKRDGLLVSAPACFIKAGSLLCQAGGDRRLPCGVFPPEGPETRSIIQGMLLQSWGERRGVTDEMSPLRCAGGGGGGDVCGMDNYLKIVWSNKWLNLIQFNKIDIAIKLSSTCTCTV